MLYFLIFYWIFATLFNIGLILERDENLHLCKWYIVVTIVLCSGIIVPIGLGVALGKKISSYDK